MYNGMNLDSEAIFEAYKNEAAPIVVVDDTLKKCYDKDGNEITIDNTKVAAARTALDTEYAKIKYKDDRKPLYPPLEDFADAMYWNSKGDSSKLTAYYAACEKVKTDNPKPS